jgi:hypothetical protein
LVHASEHIVNERTQMIQFERDLLAGRIAHLRAERDELHARLTRHPEHVVATDADIELDLLIQAGGGHAADMSHSAEYEALHLAYTRADDKLAAVEDHDRRLLEEQQRLLEQNYMDLDTGPLTDDAA